MPLYLWPEILAMTFSAFWFDGWGEKKKEDYEIAIRRPPAL